MWFRGFQDMAGRRESLSAFYDGRVWRTHRDAANATMVDSDDVLLLRPLHPVDGFPRCARGAIGEPGRAGCLVRIFHRAPGADDLARFFRERVRPVLEGTGASPVAWLETEGAVNDFPRLPVRADADVLVCISVLRDERALRSTWPSSPRTSTGPTTSARRSAAG